jgi:large subunit ribosomal protein L25
MMATLTLQATTRTVLGKQVKRLRKAGLVPGNIYGHNRESEAVQIPQRELELVAREAGSSGMVELHVDGEAGVRNVLIRRLTFNPITRRPVHADLYHVRMDEPIIAEVPIHLTGDAPAVRDEGGNVLTLLSHVRVRALPGNMPSMVTADISGLLHVDDAIAVRDLQLPDGVEATLDADELVIKVNAPRVMAEDVVAEPVPAEAPPAAE